MLLLQVFSLVAFISANEIQFDRNLIGVRFDPYVKFAFNPHRYSNLDSYTLLDLITMLKVVSTRFSRVYIANMDTLAVQYERRETYFSHMYIRGRTAEAAALINRQLNNKTITVINGIWINESRTEADAKVAIESAELANNIFPGTVEEIMLTGVEGHSKMVNTTWLNSTLYWVNKLREMSSTLNLKIGSFQPCGDFVVFNNPLYYKSEAELYELREKVVNQVDFIMCSFKPPEHGNDKGGRYTLQFAAMGLQYFQSELLHLNKNLEVMYQSYWPSKGRRPWQNIKNFEEYWLEAGNFARRIECQFWLEGALDVEAITIRTGPTQYHLGWWKPADYSQLTNASVYFEKVTGQPAILPQHMQGNLAETFYIHDYVYYANGTSSFIIFTDIANPDASVWHHLLALIPVIMLLLVATSILIRCIYLKSKTKQPYMLTSQEIDEFMNGQSSLPEEGSMVIQYENIMNASVLKIPYNRDLEIPSSSIHILNDHILGQGEFGCVFKAIIENGVNNQQREVALKTTQKNCSVTTLKGLLSEIKILQCLGNHPNINAIVGACTSQMKYGIVYLATELCPLGSLHKYLKNHRSSGYTSLTFESDSNELPICDGITYRDMLRWSHDIACGMIHLEEKNIIHADLATRNILLGADLVAKLSDFGLSRRLTDIIYTKKTEEPLPWRWMAIESLKYSRFSFQSDVWSYGVTLWEIFSLGDDPYQGIKYNRHFIDRLDGRDGMRLSKPYYASQKMYQVMLTCWNIEAEDRPSFSEIRDKLEITLRLSRKLKTNVHNTSV